jgi:hypothetical protein
VAPHETLLSPGPQRRIQSRPPATAGPVSPGWPPRRVQSRPAGRRGGSSLARLAAEAGPVSPGWPPRRVQSRPTGPASACPPGDGADRPACHAEAARLKRDGRGLRMAENAHTGHSGRQKWSSCMPSGHLVCQVVTVYDKWSPAMRSAEATHPDRAGRDHIPGQPPITRDIIPHRAGASLCGLDRLAFLSPSVHGLTRPYVKSCASRVSCKKVRKRDPGCTDGTCGYPCGQSIQNRIHATSEAYVKVVGVGFR